MPWTPDLERERFLTFRGLAWAYALRGSHQKALQYAYFARDIAPSVMWVTTCYADQAYLARMAGENRSADALLRHAVACAHETDWTSHGEERVAILNLIELVADRDLATAANRLMDIYDAIPCRCRPSSRSRATSACARWKSTRAARSWRLRRTAGAVGLLHAPTRSFQSHRLRVARGGRGAAASRDQRARRLASARRRSGSRLLGELGRKRHSPTRDHHRRPALAALTPAQRRVFG